MTSDIGTNGWHCFRARPGSADPSKHPIRVQPSGLTWTEATHAIDRAGFGQRGTRSGELARKSTARCGTARSFGIDAGCCLGSDAPPRGRLRQATRAEGDVNAPATTHLQRHPSAFEPQGPTQLDARLAPSGSHGSGACFGSDGFHGSRSGRRHAAVRPSSIAGEGRHRLCSLAARGKPGQDFGPGRSLNPRGRVTEGVGTATSRHDSSRAPRPSGQGRMTDHGCQRGAPPRPVRGRLAAQGEPPATAEDLSPCSFGCGSATVRSRSATHEDDALEGRKPKGVSGLHVRQRTCGQRTRRWSKALRPMASSLGRTARKRTVLFEEGA